MNKPQLLKLFEYLKTKKDEISSARESLPEDMERVSKCLREAQIQILVAMDELRQKM